jgi:TolB-like protein/tetratricopeptide (TPR) repeat protein
MSPVSVLDGPFRFGTYQFDPNQRILLRKGSPVRIQEKPLSLLLHLLRRSGELVTRNELRRELWPSGTYVDFDRGLSVAVHKLRVALDDASDCPRFIETVPGQGYRFIAPVIEQKVGLPPPFEILLIVLPFVGFAACASEINYIADAFTEELTAQISRVLPRQLGVIGRTTAMFYKGATKTVGTIGVELGVDYVLEGSVQNQDGKFRVVAQLIRVSDQCHIWTESVEDENDKLLHTQIELADRIARTLATCLFPGQQQVLRTRPKHQPNEEAYRHYMEGYTYYFPGPDARTVVTGLKCFHDAICADPGFPEPHALMSIMYTGAAMFGSGRVIDASFSTIALQGKQFAWRALELDPECAEANAAVAWQEFQFGWNWKSAEAYFKRALELNPNFGMTHSLYAWTLLQMGFTQQALDEVAAARVLDPLSVFYSQWEGMLRYYARDYHGAINWLEDLYRRHPDFGWTSFYLACAYIQVNRFAKAIELLESLNKFSEGHTFGITAMIRAYARAGDKEQAWHWQKNLENLPATQTANFYRHAIALASLGETNRAFEMLERALRQRSGWMPHLEIDPELDALRNDPRWKPLVEMMSAAMLNKARKGSS